MPASYSLAQPGLVTSGVSMSAILILSPLSQNVSPSITQVRRTGPLHTLKCEPDRRLRTGDTAVVTASMLVTVKPPANTSATVAANRTDERILRLKSRRWCLRSNVPAGLTGRARNG